MRSFMSRNEQDIFDVAVIGGGATGYAAALTAVTAGLRTVLFAPPSSFPPARTAALLQGSIEILTDLGIWADVMHHAAPLRAIRIVDATRRLVRAPEVTFRASEIGLAAFGYNISNSEIVEALRRRAEAVPELTLVPTPVEAIAHDIATVTLHTERADYSARLVVAADGARSKAREAADISVRSWTHRQAALVATFATARPHDGVSTEFHTEQGPFTLVPLASNRVSLVWMDRPDRTEQAASLDAAALSYLVEERAHSIHGAMRLDSPPAIFSLRAALADRFAARRTMLVGEAAHLFPPIGAQGLNLGFRDVGALKRVLARHGNDPGAPVAIDSYHAMRQSDVRSRTLAVDLLNRSLLTDFLPVQAARGIGLALASGLPVLRRALMRQGLGSVTRLPGRAPMDRTARPARDRG